MGGRGGLMNAVARAKQCCGLKYFNVAKRTEIDENVIKYDDGRTIYRSNPADEMWNTKK